MTIDQGADMSRYQGLVALDGGSLEDAAHEYFQSSEQIPTRVRLAVGEEMSPGARPPLARRRHAAAVPAQGAGARARRRSRSRRCAGRHRRRMSSPRTTPGSKAASLIETVEDLELIDPALSSERLVYRLFHERGVRVFNSVPVVAQCSCSRDSVEAMLRSFSQDDRDHMVENGVISVTCEFCSANYQFAPDDVGPRAGRRAEAASNAVIMTASARAGLPRSMAVAAASLALSAASARSAKLSGAARRRPAPGAGHRRDHERHGGDHAALRARLAGRDLAGAWRRGARC